MSSYNGHGLRSQSGMISGPIFPNIKQRPIEFKWARNHWTVDVGNVMKETEKYQMFVEGFVNFQSRDRNLTQYGQSSHRDYVNEEVRLPLLSPFDYIAESRKPRRPVFPRVNPGTIEKPVDSRTFNGVLGHLKEKVVPGLWPH